MKGKMGSAPPNRIEPYGEDAVLVIFGDAFEPAAQRNAAAFSRLLAEEAFPGFVEHVPSCISVCVYFDPLTVLAADAKSRHRLPHDIVAGRLRALLSRLDGTRKAHPAHSSARTLRIPVCYCPECGPDLAELAAMRNMSRNQAAALHSSAAYTVSMIGFLPGFPYLSGLPEALSAPRLPAPRPAVPPGSVGIAGRQTGIYPMQSPGGWRLVGRTGAVLFRPDRKPPGLMEVGDRVIFVPARHDEALSAEAMEAWD